MRKLAVIVAMSLTLSWSAASAGASGLTLKQWSRQYGPKVTTLAHSLIALMGGGTNTKVMVICVSLTREVARDRKLPSPPGAASTWHHVLSGLSAFARGCVNGRGKRLSKPTLAASERAGNAFGRMIGYMAAEGVPLGKTLLAKLTAAIKTHNATKKPAPTTTTVPSHGVGSVNTIHSVTGTYSVQLTQILDPAQPATPTFTTPKTGDRYVATVFTITDTGTQQVSDDANSDASIIGSDNQSYSPIFSNVAGCTNFNNGEYQLTPGESVSGCVVFEVPATVTVARVQWSPTSGFSSNFVQWTG